MIISKIVLANTWKPLENRKSYWQPEILGWVQAIIQQSTTYFLWKYVVVSSCFNFRSVKLHISRIRMTRLQTLDNFREKSIGRRGVVVSSLSVQNRKWKFNPKQGWIYKIRRTILDFSGEKMLRLKHIWNPNTLI